VLLVDTAGRLQNKQNLMDELKKINAVLKKLDATAPHHNLLILDATTGQNAKSQLEIFDQIVGITGLVITKLDGTAKGGIVVALAKKFLKPIYAIGIGEKIEDLQEFDAKNFAKSLVGS
jgi:fused signal recognition particle receptor